jgi:hypothetical protein
MSVGDFLEALCFLGSVVLEMGQDTNPQVSQTKPRQLLLLLNLLTALFILSLTIVLFASFLVSPLC